MTHSVTVPTQAIRNADFWLYLKAVADLGFVAEFLSRWSEACPCHEQHLLLYLSLSSKEKRSIPPPCECAMRGCRAPELASGEAMDKLGMLARSTQPLLSTYLHEATSKEVAARLCTDWERSISFIMSVMIAKCHHWSELPYLLCALGHRSPEVAARDVSQQA